MTPRTEIRKQAMAHGFSAVGFSRPETDAYHRKRLEEFIRNREYGDMAWMGKNVDARMTPAALWPDVKSVIVLGMNYAPPPDTLLESDRHGSAYISIYARNKDYHDVVKKRLKRLAGWLVQQYACDVKVFVDTAPVLEKALAAASGIGWQGKNTHLVSRRFGSWLFLGEIFTTLELPPDMPEKDRCGSCSRCMSACPTGAIYAPYKLDPRQCLSYLTIEHKGEIPGKFHTAMADRGYGCDTCLTVCPWNRFAVTTTEPAFLPRKELIAPKAEDLLSMDDPAFRRFFRGSPIKRIGVDRFSRNLQIALINIR